MSEGKSDSMQSTGEDGAVSSPRPRGVAAGHSVAGQGEGSGEESSTFKHLCGNVTTAMITLDNSLHEVSKLSARPSSIFTADSCIFAVSTVQGRTLKGTVHTSLIIHTDYQRVVLITSSMHSM